MTKVRVAINGFGRIGRLVFRAGIQNPDFEFVGINDLVPPDSIAYLLKYDSTHGRFQGTVEAKEDGIVVDLSPVTRLKTLLNCPGVQPGPIMWLSPPVYLPPQKGPENT